jgi:putative redox protein
MTDDTERSVQLERIGKGRFIVRNVRGGTITIGASEEGEFTPVELLLAAIGGCTGSDVDYITGKRAEPTEYTISVTGNKIRDEAGANRMVDLMVTFNVSFPEGEAGDAARDMLPKAMQMSHDRLCTVSRTVQLGTPIATTVMS